ncbi:LytR/AlgR family response regulator transcription factor [Flavobacterium sp.]|uniref:LytR/AlgR family response regulator transcription factor n=1 Tax=Flavobacterium sp. TaxID=239 RepID=UPI0039E5A786
MKVLVFEDEKHTAERLLSLLQQYDSSIKVEAVLSSNESGIEWYKNNPMPDLIFQDIELSDGNCFQMFEKVRINAPIIFTTAYSHFALKSFSQHSVGYVMKPYDYQEISEAIDKYKQWKDFFKMPEQESIRQIIEKLNPKNRFLFKLGDFYKTVEAKDISHFKSEDGLTVAHTFSNEKHLMETAINTLAGELDAAQFFQINRKFIISIHAIKTIRQWFNGRLKIELSVPETEEIIVSRERAKDFKDWLSR